MQNKFWRYVLPSMASQMLTGFFIIVDGFFIGQRMGDVGLAAVNILWPIAAVIQATGLGLGSGGSVLLASALGAQDEARAMRARGNALLCLGLASVLLTATLWFSYPALLRWLGAEGDLYAPAEEYVQVIILCCAAQVLNSGVNPLLRSAGRTFLAMAGMVMGLLCNIFLDWLFIMPFSWGMRGAALATVLAQLLSALFGFWDDAASKQGLEGLPPYITYEMVEAALECQEEYGHPAGCTIAQIIQESGQGDRMSRLAERDHNLFGMKWWSGYAGCPEVAGKANWATSEEYVPGEHTQITASFIRFTGDAECIRFRSRVFLQAERYSGNALIREAIERHDSDKMAEGLKDAGWATDSSYVESLKSIMAQWGLYRLDSMTVEDLKDSTANGNAIVEAAYSQLGVPYVWGGSTPGKALDCSGLTQYCYAQAGIRISHYTGSQYEELRRIPLSEAKPGDILYRSGHVAIYIGDDRYIHEPRTGDVCRIASGIGSFSCALTAR